jgi:catechol 2,3-dioxygenase-like lactoylglutathione lyase family enzyme
MTQLEEQKISDARVAAVDMKVEVVVIPVSDVERAKDFYGRLGWRLDAGFRFDNGFRWSRSHPRLRVLNTIRHEGYAGRSRLGKEGSVSSQAFEYGTSSQRRKKW